MKKSIILGLLAVAGVAFTSCDDFLNDSRFPYTSETDSPEFWNTTTNVEQECNKFYNNFSGYGNGAGPAGDFYFAPLNDDNANSSFKDWYYTNVPSSSSDWSTPFTHIRHAMCIIKGVRGSSLSEADRANFEGIARLNRALQYFDLVKKFGDVTWVSEVVDVNSDGVLYGARTNRDVVMDSVLNDLNYAIAAISTNKGTTVWSKDMARAAKCDICLWEGTFCKYRTAAENGYAADETRANKFLNECVRAYNDLKGYSLNADYTKVYTNLSSQISSDKEWIFGKAYVKDILMNPLIGYLVGSTPINGITKDAFDSYLFTDGLPLGLTSCDTSDKGVWDAANGQLDISALLAVRDGRLAKTIDPVIYYAGKTSNLSYDRGVGINMTSRTGYGIRKYDDLSLPVADRKEAGKSYCCAPIYYYSEILCDYAEAQAELGNTTEATAAINKLLNRAGLPDLKTFHDPANTIGVSDIVWEARRCRRCELIMDRQYRYWDLVRWHQLDKLDSNKFPNIKLGANFTGSPVEPAYSVGEYLDGYAGSNRVFDKKYYLFPIPSGQLTLAPNLKQNPGW